MISMRHVRIVSATWQWYQQGNTLRAIRQFPVCENLAAIIDVPGVREMKRGSRSDQRVEIDHRFSLFRVESAEIGRIIRIVCADTQTADDLISGVDRGGGRILARIDYAKVFDRAVTPHYRVVIRTIQRKVSASNYLALIINRHRIRGASAESAEVDHCTVRPH